jgi:hypothetical protein
MSIRTEDPTEEQAAALARVNSQRQAIEAAFTAWVEAVEAAARLNDFAEDAPDEAMNSASDCMESVDEVVQTLNTQIRFRD